MKSIVYPFLITSVLILVTFGLFQQLESELPQKLTSVNQYRGSFALISFLVLAGDILLPVPSSIVMYLNGMVLGIVGGTLLSFGALMIGSVIGYLIGKFSTQVFKNNNNERALAILENYGPAILVLTRGIPILSESLCFVCGYNRTNFKKYLLFNAIGYLPVCLIYSIFGSLAKSDSSSFLWSFAASIAISGLVWFIGRKLFQPAHFNRKNEA